MGEPYLKSGAKTRYVSLRDGGATKADAARIANDEAGAKAVARKKKSRRKAKAAKAKK